MAVVVGAQFCAPYPIILTVVKKAFSWSGGDFTVKDQRDNVVFRVDGVAFSRRERRILLDAAGNPLISFQHKIFTWHGRWKVFRGDSSSERDLLFSVKRSSLFQFKPKFHVFLASNTSEATCDFEVKGSYFQRSCAIHLGESETILAQMSRKYTLNNVLLGKDTFVVTIDPNVDSAFIVSLIVILDEIKRRKKRSTATTTS